MVTSISHGHRLHTCPARTCGGYLAAVLSPRASVGSAAFVLSMALGKIGF